MNFLDCSVLQDMKLGNASSEPAQSLQTENGHWSECRLKWRERTPRDGRVYDCEFGSQNSFVGFNNQKLEGGYGHEEAMLQPC